MTPPTGSLPGHRPARARDLRASQWLLLVEALAMLAGSSLAIALLPFRRVVRLASPRRAPAARPDEGRTDEARWAVEAVAWRVPWRTVCFQKGLALHLMLGRRGIPSVLHYGVGKEADDRLAAHVWISVDGEIVMGGDVVDRFRCLAAYPAVP